MEKPEGLSAKPSLTVAETASASVVTEVNLNAPVRGGADPTLAAILDTLSHVAAQVAVPEPDTNDIDLQTTPVREVKAPNRDHLVALAVPRRGRKLRFAIGATTLVAVLGIGWFAGLNATFLDIAQSTAWLQQSGSDLKSSFASVQRELADQFERVARPSVPVVEVSQYTPAEKPTTADVSEHAANRLSIKLDHMRASFEAATRALSIEIERLQRSVEGSQGELAAKLELLAERVERVAHQVAPARVATVAQASEELTAPSPTKLSPLPVQRPATAANAKVISPPASTESRRGMEPTVIKQWRVREVLNGMALLEGPRGIVGVSAGQTVPGLGRVESIVRRGNGWVVATRSGIIGGGERRQQLRQRAREVEHPADGERVDSDLEQPMQVGTAAAHQDDHRGVRPGRFGAAHDSADRLAPQFTRN